MTPENIPYLAQSREMGNYESQKLEFFINGKAIFRVRFGEWGRWKMELRKIQLKKEDMIWNEQLHFGEKWDTSVPLYTRCIHHCFLFLLFSLLLLSFWLQHLSSVIGTGLWRKPLSPTPTPFNLTTVTQHRFQALCFGGRWTAHH